MARAHPLELVSSLNLVLAVLPTVHAGHYFDYLYEPFANESSRLDENLLMRSQFYSDHRVNLSTYRYCQSATFGPLAFLRLFFVFYDIKSKRISNRHSCYVYIRSECGSCPADVATAARPGTAMVDFIVLSIKLVFMVLVVSYSQVLAQRPTGCCSASCYYAILVQTLLGDTNRDM